MTFQKPDASYWNNKLAAYLHDPIDKVFQIKGHEERAARHLEAFGLQKPNEKFWGKADGIASGFERGQVPSYSRNPTQNGAVDFSLAPIITHPTAKDIRLEIDLPKVGDAVFTESVMDQLLAFLKKNIGMQPGSGGYSDHTIFKNNPENFAFARFLYIHYGLRFKLAENDVAGLGGLWHRLPADSRFPDHTIWQHNALTSAIYSCMDIAKDNSQIGMLTFSITPVQPFIAKARKLRDYWTSSILLSWLAFEGLRWVIEYLGPDHLLYPSLIDQPLVNEYLKTTWNLDDITSFCKVRDIASLPNKFMCLVPLNKANSIAEGIRHSIQNSWSALSRMILKKTTEVLNERGEHLAAMFERQTEKFWDFQWSAVKLLEKNDIGEANSLLPKGALKEPVSVFEEFASLVRRKWNYEMDARGLLYSCTHQLAQTALAARKTFKKVTRAVEPGQKCKLCAEFEVLHSKPYDGDEAAHDYKDHIDEFWKNLADAWGTTTDIEDSEKLCSLCLTKRIAHRVLKEDKAHILRSCFDSAESFPSTTVMAMYDEFKRRNITEPNKKREIAQRVHDKEGIENVDNRNRYYAILVMDGDHMGKLINGETIGSTWSSFLHPEMKKRLESASFDGIYRKGWQPFITKDRKRLITPSIHAAISESLGDFSIYGASEIVTKYDGRLIYAGGDDVCAVMPVSTVVKAASEISQYYNANFKIISAKGTANVTDRWKPAVGKLSVSLGKNESKISISAGILVCHHKEGLSQMIARAHTLLDLRAKEMGGRNACAIELRKRSGGSRYFARKWDDTPAWDAFENLGQWIKSKNKQQVSTSLIYRLELFRDGVEAMLQKENYKELLSKLIKSQLERSGIKPAQVNQDEFAQNIVEIIVDYNEEGKPKFHPEGLIVAAFIADTESEVN